MLTISQPDQANHRRPQTALDQRRNPAQRTGCRYRRCLPGEQNAFPRIHLLVVGWSGRSDHRPDGEPCAPADPGDHFPGAFVERAVRASALARTMSGSRGPGASASSHGRSLRALGRLMRVRFITNLPKATDRARAWVGRVVSLAGAYVLGLSVVP